MQRRTGLLAEMDESVLDFEAEAVLLERLQNLSQELAVSNVDSHRVHRSVQTISMSFLQWQKWLTFSKKERDRVSVSSSQ
jgi:hypothetical protein